MARKGTVVIKLKNSYTSAQMLQMVSSLNHGIGTPYLGLTNFQESAPDPNGSYSIGFSTNNPTFQVQILLQPKSMFKVERDSDGKMKFGKLAVQIGNALFPASTANITQDPKERLKEMMQNSRITSDFGPEGENAPEYQQLIPVVEQLARLLQSAGW